jgi:DNA-binding LacI/PurR family transcriptional regulator
MSSRNGTPGSQERSRIQDVAKLARVSLATASHALNGKGRVSEKTQARIVAAAAKLGYRANPSAVSLRTGQSKLLGIQLGRLGRKGLLIPAAAYFGEILNGVSTEAFRRGWTPVFLPRDVALVDVKSLNFGGGVIVDPQGDESLLRMLIATRRPVITTGRPVNLDHQANVLSIDNDVAAVTKAALGHLVLMGYRRPALIVSKSTASYVIDAEATAVIWGKERKLSVPIVKVQQATSSGAEQALLTLLRRNDGTDSIYAIEESGALGALRAARVLGLDVPAELGIVCGLDGPALREAWPPITGIDLRPELVGRRAARQVIEYAEAKVKRAIKAVVPFSIQERRSTDRRAQRLSRRQ